MSTTASVPTASGIIVATSAEAKLADAMAEIAAVLEGRELEHLLVYFSGAHDARALSDAFAEALPGVPMSGCSTAGEIGPLGLTEGGIQVIAFPKDGFRVHAALLENLQDTGVESATEVARRLKANVKPCSDRRLHERAFALMLVDGLSNYEEMLVAAVHWALDDIQLVGGSAGDGLAFRSTALMHAGRVANSGAILMIVETDFPFRAFKTQNFEPTPIKLVVTAADTENRIVHELNAEPAAREYATAIGLLPDDLGPFSFASYPLVVKIGGDYYCRSIRNMNADGSLSFFCAIDEGLVFTVARPQDMLSATRTALADLDQSLGGIDLVLGFDCVLRRLDAENRQIRHHVEDLYRRFRVAGFQTYGEQFNAMHLNQTLTGIAIGKRQVAS